jgi:hypothetical protein
MIGVKKKSTWIALYNSCLILVVEIPSVRFKYTTSHLSFKKSNSPSQYYEQRKMMLESIRYVDLVIPENDWGQKEIDVDRFEVDVFLFLI